MIIYVFFVSCVHDISLEKKRFGKQQLNRRNEIVFAEIHGSTLAVVKRRGVVWETLVYLEIPRTEVRLSAT